MSASEGKHVWSDGKEAVFEFKFSGEYENILLEMTHWTHAGKQDVSIYVNDYLIANYIANGKENKKIIIPKEHINNGVIELKFCFPNAVSPKELGTGTDGRKLALAFSSLILSSTDEVFDEEKQTGLTNYLLGTELSFTKEDNSANQYCIKGFSGNESNQTWMVGNEAEMQFKFNTEESIELSMEHGTYETQEVLIYANDNLIANYIAKGITEKTIIIPKQYIENEKLSLRFELPDATSPLEKGTGTDSRKLGLSMRTMTLSATNDSYEESKQIVGYYYELGTELSFKKENPTANRYCVKGFSGNENSQTWTTGTGAEMQFRIGEAVGNLNLVLEYGRVHNSSQRVTIYANDTEIANYIATKGERKEILIPSECISNGILKLRIELPDAVSPKECGTGTDSRLLALAMKSITIHSSNEEASE